MAKIKQNILNEFTIEHLKKVQMFWFVSGFCCQLESGETATDEDMRRGITAGISLFNESTKNSATPADAECQRQTYYRMQEEFREIKYRKI